MLSYELQKNINEFLSEVQKHKSFLKCLEDMSMFYTAYFRDSLPRLLVSYKDVKTYASRGSEIKNEFIKKILNDVKSSMTPSALIINLNQLKYSKSLRNIPDSDSMALSLDKFTTLLDNYLLNTEDMKNNLELIFEGHNIYQILNNYKVFNNLLKPLLPDIQEEKDTIQTTIILYNTTDYERFTNKLVNIKNIYSELCQLLKISIANFPIKLIKIESGSLFSKFSGNKNVINMFLSVFENGVRYLYEKYTTDGKISKIPREVKSAEAVLKLSGLLKNQGIDTTEMDDHIGKASVAIAKNLNKLLLGEPVIEINGKIISLSEEREQHYIEESNKLLLENKTDDV